MFPHYQTIDMFWILSINSL